MKLPSITKCLILIVMFTLLESGLVGYIGWWREWFWSAVSNRDFHHFLVLIGYFSCAALAACFIRSYGNYLVNYAALIYRTKLTRKALKLDYLSIEGGRQRVQEDCSSYPQLSLSLLSGGLQTILILFVYSFILVKQLGFLYLLIPISYAFIGTWVAQWLAKPLIKLNYFNQVLEAKFRQSLTKVNYSQAYRNNYNLFRATKTLSYFQIFYSQITVIIPQLILCGIYFTGQITFGVLMQCGASIAEVINCLSYFITSFGDINKWLSCRKRLKELKVI